MPAAFHGLPPSSVGSMPRASRDKVSSAPRPSFISCRATRRADTSLSPLAVKISISSWVSVSGQSLSRRSSSAMRLLAISRALVTDSHSPRAIEQAPDTSPAIPVRTMDECAMLAPATPITRHRFDTRPSLAPSTAARSLVPASRSGLASGNAHCGGSASGRGGGVSAGMPQRASMRKPRRGKCTCTVPARGSSRRRMSSSLPAKSSSPCTASTP